MASDDRYPAPAVDGFPHDFANYAVQDMDRDGWLECVQAGYMCDLPLATGATISYVDFSTILADTILSYQSFVATLVNK